jgi:uncharacterized delta-60 repeat protein
VELLEDRIVLSSVTSLPQCQQGLSPDNVASPSTCISSGQTLIAHEGDTAANNDAAVLQCNFSQNNAGTLQCYYNGTPVVVQSDSNGPYIIAPGTQNKIYFSQLQTASMPADVTGASYLTDPSPITLANGTRMSFTDVKQFVSPTCSFAATLAAVARTNFNLANSLTLVKVLGPNDLEFGIRLFTPNSQGVYEPTWVDVEFNGKIYPTDLQSTDPSVYWPTLFQRAYLTLCQETGASISDVGQAFRALTGLPYSFSNISSSDSTLSGEILADLNSGEPVIASTPGDDDPAHPLINDGTGLIQDHAYTVLGIDSGPSGAFVTLRNPWAQDTAWMYFDKDNDGSLSLSEDAALRTGLDGYNDGIIRIPWATFTRDFYGYLAGDLTGPSINTPQSLSPPQFRQAGLGAQTVTAGTTLTLDLSAVAPDGGTISYFLDTNDPSYGGSPGTLDLHTGSYSWAVPSNQRLGTYLVTAVAQVSPVEASALTFPVTVVSPVPQVNSVTADRMAISTADGQVTITATVASYSPVEYVAFWRDTNHNGQIDATDEKLAFLPGNSTGTYTWSGTLQNLTPGTSETLFFEAEHDTGQGASFHAYNGTGAVSLPVIAGASLPPLVALVGVETLANPPGTGYQTNPLVAYDGAGDSAIFWSNQTTNQVWMRRFDPTGRSIGSPVSLDIVQGIADDVAMLPDGHFVILWTGTSGDLRAKEFNADGTPYPGIYDYVAVDPGPVLPGARIAMSAVGEYAAVYAHGNSGPATSYLSRFSSGIAYGAVRLDNGQDAEQLAVAMDSNGMTLASWVDTGSAQVMAERFDADPMTTIGSVIVVNTIAGSAVTTPVGSALAAAIDGRGRIVIAWSAYNGTTDVVMARRFLPDLTPIDATEFQVNDSASATDTDLTPRVAFQANRFVITWTDETITRDEVYAQAFTWENTLRRLGGNFEVPTTTTGDQYGPVVAIDNSATNFIVAWISDSGSDRDFGAYFKRFNGLDAAPEGFALQALPPQKSSLATIPLAPKAGELLGLFTDPIAGSWTYSLVAGPGDTDNPSFQLTNGFLSMTQAGAASGLKANYSIRVHATPAFGVPAEQVFNFASAASGPINFGQLGPALSQAYGVAYQTNGDFVLVGETSSSVGLPGNTALARFLPDGTPDPTFGGTGMVVAHLLDGFNYAANVVVQRNGQIVVAGYGYSGLGCAANADQAFVARFNPDGSLDSSFGNSGVIIVANSNGANPAVALQDDGDIVVAANGRVARYMPDGTPDSGFGTDGAVTLALGGTNENAEGLAIDSNGKVVVSGYEKIGSNNEPFIARFLANGSLDTSFGGVGYVALGNLTGGQRGYRVAVGSDGTILLGGSFGIWRVEPDGRTDTTWGGTGVVRTPAESTSVVPIRDLVVDPDGNILATGTAWNGTDDDFVFMKYSAGGSLETLKTKNFGADDYSQALALSNNAQCVIAGYTGPLNQTTDDFAPWQLDVSNVPMASVQGPPVAVPGQLITFTLGAVSPSHRDDAGGFMYSINWGDRTGAHSYQGKNGISVPQIYRSAGSYQVALAASDQEGTTSQPVASSISIVPVAIEPDAVNPTEFDVVVGGTTGNDKIQIVPGNSPGLIAVTINGNAQGQFPVTGSIDIFTDGSSDTIDVSPEITLPTFVNDSRIAVTASLSRSTVSLAPTGIVAGQTTRVTLTARNASGVQQAAGGLVVNFGLAAGSSGGTFGPITDNRDGTYSATFKPSEPGTDTFTATIGGQIVTSAAPALTVTSTPSIIGLSPTSATEGAGQFTLTVTGTNFASGYSVLWNNTALATNFVSATTLTATVPASDVTQPGTFSVAIGYFGKTSSNPQSFTVVSQPAVTGLSPTSAVKGSGQITLIVSGANFVNGSAVLWNGTGLGTAFVSGGTLKATVPASLMAQPGVASVAVENPGDVTSQATLFTIVGTGRPQVTGIIAGSHSAGGLVSIIVSFNEPMNPGSVVNTGAYTVKGAVKKKGRTVYTKALSFSVTYNARAMTVTIRLLAPYKGGVQVTAKRGLKSAGGPATPAATKPAVVV